MSHHFDLPLPCPHSLPQSLPTVCLSTHYLCRPLQPYFAPPPLLSNTSQGKDWVFEHTKQAQSDPFDFERCFASADLKHLGFPKLVVLQEQSRKYVEICSNSNKDLWVEVTWDEPEVLQNAKRVSPWQVDFVASTPSLHPAPPFHTVHPLTKRFRAPLNPALLRDGEEEFMIPMTGAANSTMGQYNASMLNYNIFPAGMQGARQDLFCDSNASHLFTESTPRMCTYNSFGNNNMATSLKRVSTELNIGSPQSDQLSPDSQSSPQSFGTEPDGNRNSNSRKVGRSSFQLFGQTIPINDIDAVGCTGDGGNIGYNETELLNNPLDSYTKLLERIDVRVSAVEACTL